MIILLSVVLTLSLFPTTLQANPNDLLKKGKQAFDESQFLRAENYYRQAMEAFHGRDEEKFFYTRNRLGDVLRISGKERESEILLRKAEQEIRRRFPNSLLLADCYDILGELYYYISDAERAGNYFRGALAIKSRLLKPNDARLALSLSNVGRYYNYKQRHDLAFKYTTRAYQILENHPTHLSEIVPELIYCEHAYSIKGLPGYKDDKYYSTKVRSVLLRAIEANQKHHKKDNYWQAYVFHYLGNTYTDQLAWIHEVKNPGPAAKKFHRRAMGFYRNAERIYKKFLPNNNPRLSMTYFVMGLANDYNHGDPKVSISYYDKSLQQALPSGGAGEKNLFNAFNQHQVLSILSYRLKSTHQLFKVSGKESYGKEVLNQADIMHMIWLKMLSEYQLNKYFGLTTFYYRIPYEFLLDVCHQLSVRYPDKGFQEKALGYLELSKYKQINKEPIRTLKEARRVYNEYFRDVRAIVSTTPAHTAIVEFWDGEIYKDQGDTQRNPAYTILIRNKRVEIFKTDISREAQGYLQNFLVNLQTQNVDVYRDYTYQLYQKFLGPLKLDKTVKNLWIIPGLSYTFQIPFSALVSDKNGTSYKTLNYLLNKYSISWSMGLVDDARRARNKNFPEKNILYVAPENNGYAQLPFAEQLIGKLYEKYSGDVVKKTEATSSVMKAFKKYDVVHLATHAVVNDKNPDSSYLVFFDRKVNSSEIYNLKLNSSLINLSACETVKGVTTTHNGGIYNFVRAFSSAGSRSITSTLWKVDDEMTARIYQDFFDGLAAGNEMDVSLRNAKQKYLDNCLEAGANPYYWAGIVLYGQTRAIEIEEKKSNRNLFVLITTLTAVLALVFLIRRKVTF